MKPSLYLDVYLVLNALMNYVCIYTSGCIFFGIVKKPKVSLAAFLGCAYSLLPLLLPLRGVSSLILWLGVLSLMCRIAFGKNPFPLFLSSVVMTLLLSATAGGLLELAVQNAQSTSGKLILSLAAGIAIFTLSGVRYFAEKAREKLSQARAQLEFDFQGEHFCFMGFCDSGNLLRESTCGLPVILLASPLKHSKALAPYYEKEGDWPKNLYLIPVQSAVEQKLLLGFRPENLTLCVNGKKKIPRQAILAADPDCPSFGDCLCLIPTVLL